MEQVRKFALDVGWGLVGSVATLIISFLLRVPLARWLGATDLGLYTMVITIQGIAVAVATVGIPLALVKYVAEYKDDRYKLFETVSAAFISSVIFGLVVGVLLYALSGVLAGAFDMPELAHLLKILAFVFPFASIFETLLGLFNGLRQMKTYAYLMILRSLLMMLFIVGLVWLGFGVKGATLGVVFSVVGGCIFGLYLSRKSLHPSLHGLYQGAKRLISFGSQIFAADSLGLILQYTDIIMIGYFLASKDVGYYSIAVGLSTFFLLVPQAIQRITYPATSEYWSQNNLQALRQMIDKSMKYSACILLPLGLGIGFFAKEIVTGIFGQEFIYAALPLCVLLVARVIRGGTIVPIGACFSGIGRPDLPLKISAISAGTNVGLNILLIPPLGIVGAAIATTISLLIGVVISLVLVPRILGARIDIKWYAQAIGFACMGIALYLVGTRLVNPYVAGGVIFFGYAVLVFKVFLTKEDRAILRSLAFSLVLRR
jgi:O-antigen/teichoic acid export membrane protein